MKMINKLKNISAHVRHAHSFVYKNVHTQTYEQTDKMYDYFEITMQFIYHSYFF